MALCIEGSLFGFCFPIKNKSVLKPCWLLIRGAEGPELGGQNLCLGIPPSSEPSGSAQGVPPSLSAFPSSPGFCCAAPAPGRSELFSPQHPTQAPSQHHISVAPSSPGLPVLPANPPRAAQPCLCLPEVRGSLRAAPNRAFFMRTASFNTS